MHEIQRISNHIISLVIKQGLQVCDPHVLLPELEALNLLFLPSVNKLIANDFKLISIVIHHHLGKLARSALKHNIPDYHTLVTNLVIDSHEHVLVDVVLLFLVI